MDKLINSSLDSELKYVDIEPPKKDDKNKNCNNFLKDNIKFDPSCFNMQLYINQVGMLVIATIISIAGAFMKDYLSLFNPIIMWFIITLFSSNQLEINDNRYLDISVCNLSNSTNMIIKSLNLADISAKYEGLVKKSTNLFGFSLFLCGNPVFNPIIIVLGIGVIFSYTLAFANKDLGVIRDSLKSINEKALIGMILSPIIFVIFLKGTAINLMVFTFSMIISYTEYLIADYEIEDII
jgi:hypothetical protein